LSRAATVRWPFKAGEREVLVKLRMISVCCAVLALTVGVATATAGGGNSANAKKCQKGGWQNWVREDGSAFANQDECVSYGATGGVLTVPVPKTQSQIDCESIGGQFGAENLTEGSGTVLWSCNHWTNTNNGEFLTLRTDCIADGGVAFAINGPFNDEKFTCFKT
jgi:hypothetical protein